jgi:hypothetical protein
MDPMSAAVTVLRRFIVLCAAGLWLGGLTFYTTRVIRAAHQVIVSHAKVGFVTRQVTADLNAIGVGALFLLLGNVFLSWRPAGRWNRVALAASWIVAAASLAWLYLLHARLDTLLDVPAQQVREGVAFHGPHETYLIATALEWGAGLVHVVACLTAWRREDTLRPDQR